MALNSVDTHSSLATVGHSGKPNLRTGLTATGTNQATALMLAGNTQHEFGTVAASTGCILPVPTLPSEVSVFNAGASTLAVYPPAGGYINGGTINAPYSLASASGVTFWASSTNSWYSLQSDTGGGGGSGTVTSVATGTGLTGGPITATGTVSIAAGGVGTTQLADGAVTEAKMTLANNTTGNVSTTAHGFAPIAPNDATKFLNGVGAYSVPPAGSGTVTSIVAGAGLTGGTITTSGTVALSPTGLVLTQYSSPITADADGATITFDLATSNWHSVTLGGNRTLAVSNPTTGQQFNIVLTQDGTGGRTVTSWFSGITWPGNQTPSLSITPGYTDTFSFKCTGVGTYLGFPGSVNVGANTILANTTGGVAAPGAVSISAAFDALLGSSQGSILYRGASLWNPLTPGTNGQFLQTQGASSNPQWASPAGAGTVNSGTTGQVAYYASSSAAVSGESLSALIDAAIDNAQGDILYRGSSAWSALAAGTNLNPLQSGGSAANPSWNPNILLPSAGPTRYTGGTFINITGPGTAIANTAAQTSIFTGATFRAGQSLTIAANSLAVGDIIRVFLFGTFGCTSAAPTLQPTCLLGGVTLAQGNALALNATAVTNGPWMFLQPMTIVITAIGSSGGAFCWSNYTLVSNATNTTVSSQNFYNGGPSCSGTPAVVNTTIGLAIDFKFQWGTASTSNTIQVTGGWATINS